MIKRINIVRGLRGTEILSYVSLILMLFICFITILSCRNKTNKTVNDICNLENNEFKLPKYNFTGSSKELKSFLNKKYKIVVCIDSAGCFSCHLQLEKWKSYIKEMQNKKINISVLFYVNLQNKFIIDVEFINNGFTYPYFWDNQDSIHILNKIPDNEDMQTFLLNENNKVIGVGNPVINPSIKDFYYKLIFKQAAKSKTNNKINGGGLSLKLSPKNINTDIHNKCGYTYAKIKPMKIDFGIVPLGKTIRKKILIKNVGSKPLIVRDAGASCDCIKVKLPKREILSGHIGSIYIFYKASHEIEFYESINILTNSTPEVPQIQISGTVEK